MRNYSVQRDCILRILYVDERCSKYSLLEAGLIISSALLLSYGIRRWVCLELYIKYCPLPSIERTLRIATRGSSIKGVSPHEPQLMGFVEHMVRRGYWPGVNIKESSIESIYEGNLRECISLLEFLETVKCTSCVHLDRRELPADLQPWWILSSALVLYDANCIQRYQ